MTEHFYLPTEVNFNFYALEENGSESSFTASYHFSYDQADLQTISYDIWDIVHNFSIYPEHGYYSVDFSKFIDSVSFYSSSEGVEVQLTDGMATGLFSVAIKTDFEAHSYDVSESYLQLGGA